MSKKDNLRLQINKDLQLEPMLCSNVSCENPLRGQQRKFCSEKCRQKVSIEKACKERKSVYRILDGHTPRRMISESSIKKNESLVLGDGRFSVDDYHVDPEIFAIAEANHERYVLDRNEYEARVVIDGLDIFVEEYNKHHDKPYACEQAKKREANLTEDQKIGRKIQQAEYQRKNRIRLNEKQKIRQRERYAKNPEKYRKRARENYFKKTFPQYQYEQWLKKRISGS
jgi:hypothetical protein